MESISKIESREMQSKLINSDEFKRILSAFETTKDKLVWREDKNGVLYVGDSSNPTLIARLEIMKDDSIHGAIADVEDVPINWHELTPV